jgi:hypothetical protein
LLKNRRFKRAFDAMLPWPGLWQPVQIGALRRINRIKCPEVCSALVHSACADKSRNRSTSSISSFTLGATS